MTDVTEQSYSAIAIAKSPVGHAHIVDLLVEVDEGIGLLSRLNQGTPRLYTREEYDEHVALERATPLKEPVDVCPNTFGLVVSNDLVNVADQHDFRGFGELDGPVNTGSDYRLFLGPKEALKDQRNSIARDLTELIKSSIVDRLIETVRSDERPSAHAVPDSAAAERASEILKEPNKHLGSDDTCEVDWQELITWTDFAIDSSGARWELRYEPVLLRCWLLRRQLESTKMRNFFQNFVADHLSWEEFEKELDALEQSFRSSVERRLWLKHRRIVEEERKVSRVLEAKRSSLNKPGLRFLDSKSGGPRIPS